MAHRIFKCESCPTEIGVDKKLKERPLACPKCRGMVSFDREGDLEGKTYDCPNCENSFVCTQEPFKCPFCDYTFSKRYKYF